MKIRKILSTSLISLFLPMVTGSAQDAAVHEVHGIVVANIDRSVKPGDDFYRFANGEWIKRTEIPPDRGGVDVWTKLTDLSNQRSADLIKELASSNPAAGSNSRKVADLFNSYMDEAAIEAKGLAPLKPHLAEIAAIHNKKELAQTLGETLRADVDALNNTNFHTPNLFGLWVAPGFNDSDHYAPYLMQGGGQLPDREYYLSDSESMQKIRKQVPGTRIGHAEANRIYRYGCASEPHHRTRDRDCEDASHALPTVKTFTRRTIPGSVRSSQQRLRALTGLNISRARDLAGWRVSSCGSRKPSRANRR